MHYALEVIQNPRVSTTTQQTSKHESAQTHATAKRAQCKHKQTWHINGHMNSNTEFIGVATCFATFPRTDYMSWCSMSC